MTISTILSIILNSRGKVGPFHDVLRYLASITMDKSTSRPITCVFVVVWLWNNSSYWVASHIFGFFTIQKHDVVFREVDIGAPLSLLNLRYKMYVVDISLFNIPYFDKYGIAAGGMCLIFPSYIGLQETMISFKSILLETHETNMRNQDDIDYILEDYI